MSKVSYSMKQREAFVGVRTHDKLDALHTAPRHLSSFISYTLVKIVKIIYIDISA